MGRRGRQRDRAANVAPAVGGELTRSYTDADGNELVLRGVLRPGARRHYAETLGAGTHREDAWQRATELLFEQLAVRWTVNGVATDGPRELLARYRAASPDERRFVRDSLREHLADLFPEMETP